MKKKIDEGEKNILHSDITTTSAYCVIFHKWGSVTVRRKHFTNQGSDDRTTKARSWERVSWHTRQLQKNVHRIYWSRVTYSFKVLEGDGRRCWARTAARSSPSSSSPRRPPSPALYCTGGSARLVWPGTCRIHSLCTQYRIIILMMIIVLHLFHD